MVCGTRGLAGWGRAAPHSLFAMSAEEAGTARAGGWSRFLRVGTVRATRLDYGFDWTSPRGDRLHGNPGDWRVEDESGGVRAVKDASFRATHERVGEDRWRRVAVVRARTARSGERVDTQEGPSIAEEGDWLVEDADGHRWLVPNEHFVTAYTPELSGS